MWNKIKSHLCSLPYYAQDGDQYTCPVCGSVYKFESGYISYYGLVDEIPSLCIKCGNVHKLHEGCKLK